MIELLRTYHDIWSSDSVLELRYRFKEKVSFEGIAVQKATLDSLGRCMPAWIPKLKAFCPVMDFAPALLDDSHDGHFASVPFRRMGIMPWFSSSDDELAQRLLSARQCCPC